MKHFRVSITTKLLGLFLAVGIVTLLIVGAYSFYSARRAIIIRTIDQLISLKATKKQQVEYFFEEKIKNLENLARYEILLTYSGSLRGNQFPGNINVNALTRLKNEFLSYGFTHRYLPDPGFKQIITVDSNSSGLSFVIPSLIKTIHEISSRIDTSVKTVVSDLFFKSPDDTLPVAL